jgi:hypothetical protein
MYTCCGLSDALNGRCGSSPLSIAIKNAASVGTSSVSGTAPDDSVLFTKSIVYDSTTTHL